MKFSSNLVVLLIILVVSALVVTFFLKRENFTECNSGIKPFSNEKITGDLPLNFLDIKNCDNQRICNSIVQRPISSNTPQNFEEF